MLLEGILKKIFGDPNEKEIKNIRVIVDKINSLEKDMETLSSANLAAKTGEFKVRLQKGETLDDILPEAFAVVREASRRVTGMRHFDVQLIGGVVLHRGKIAEMRTGEGKTLVATAPVYLNALTGKGVHVVTVNDYLARRDSEDMGRIYKFLGLSVGLIVHDMDFPDRKAAYAADITYGTNNEFGFDYLRDNMVVDENQMVQRELNYCIVDEVDSILIDEARTPLIISGPGEKSTELYQVLARVVANMEEGEDYTVDEKQKQVAPTEKGIAKAEKMLGIGNLYDNEHGVDYSHQIMCALKAKALMHRDRDYVVKDGQVIIVDEFPGRLMFGRRFSEGLHQAIEAKEGVKVERESQTLATITFQNYFRMYHKLAGMTGTASTESGEFWDIYKLDVVEIPTNRPIQRKDLDDRVYKTAREKYRAVIDEIEETRNAGRPVLVGTTSVEISELLSKMLKMRNIPHNVLNAKLHQQEAQIVAEAGRSVNGKGAVTIATNMAGRGTDIKLTPEVKAAGGLAIIGTERHESRRIDNQLRGRSGRQGDPGESKFYLSLEDDLMRLFGSERVMSLYDTLKIPEGEEIQHKTISNFVEKAQKKIESNNFAIRKNLLEYDRVNNEQREIIYKERRRVLDGEDMHEVILKMLKDDIGACVDIVCSSEAAPEEWNIVELDNMIREIIPFTEPIALTEHEIKKGDTEELKERLYNEAVELYHEKEKEFPSPEDMREIERIILLKVIDRKWTDHIDDMEQLKQGIGLQSLGQRDPVVEYKFAGYDMFNEMTRAIQEDTVKLLLRVKVEQKVEREEVNKVTGTNKDDTVSRGPVKKAKKIGRNDLCPCGSGKKYKNCCGRNE